MKEISLKNHTHISNCFKHLISLDEHLIISYYHQKNKSCFPKIQMHFQNNFFFISHEERNICWVWSCLEVANYSFEEKIININLNKSKFKNSSDCVIPKVMHSTENPFLFWFLTLNANFSLKYIIFSPWNCDAYYLISPNALHKYA